MTTPDPMEERRRIAEARVATSADQWRSRSRRIRLLRRVLPAVILILAGGALSWIVLRTVISGVEREASQSGEVRIDAPMFRGQDAEGRSFVIGAEGAVRDPETGRYRLNGPLLRLNLGGAKVTEITADAGVYDVAAQTVTLGANVRISDAESGLVLTTPEAVMDTETGVVTGSRGIQGRGPLGTIDASSYAIYEQGDRIVFSGSGEDKVRGTLNLARSGE